MSDPNSKPDLEDSINVTEAHGRITRELAASSREKKITDNGRGPISLWIIAAGGAAVLIAGGILGDAGSLFGGTMFSYSSMFRANYVRSAAPGAGDTGPPTKPALVAYSARGAKLYSAKCNGCHGADAKGDGANYPPLAGSKYVLGETERFAMIVLNGIHGPTSSGRDYGGTMPAQGPGMSAADLAGVMTYVRNNFGNSAGDVVTVAMAADAMKTSAARANAGQAVTSEEINAEHLKNLPGDPLDPTTLVNTATLEPAPAAP
ncbi:cytochrome c [Luteolibacter pohnpeiensis]|uniref:Cytochrome c n=1 Tax=Luteolibacter pohnpeiensis TaxID=454153 RepID=A0A934SAM2_9BACT|nr:cytochrome c [Luteolibacter pohnpeiensis]MBK1884354.1 cytochrome c [Luteolibacter pohnpeiensis]